MAIGEQHSEITTLSASQVGSRFAVICIRTADEQGEKRVHCIETQKLYCLRYGYDFIFADRADASNPNLTSREHCLVIDDLLDIRPTAPALPSDRGIYTCVGSPEALAAVEALARGGAEVVPLPAQWAETESAGYASAFGFRFADDAPFQPGEGEHPLRARDEEEEISRIRSMLHRAGRARALSELNKEPEKYLLLKRVVETLTRRKRLTLPRLVRDNPAAWLWRYEYLSSLLDPEMLEIIARVAPGCSWAIDGGAHVGYITSAIRSANSSCTIYAVEAHPLNAITLTANVAGELTQVTTAALGSEPGTVLLHDGDGHSNSSLSSEVVGGGERGAFAVRATTMDLLVEGRFRQAPGLIKLDIEGYEPEALRGSSALLSENHELAIILEVNPSALAKRGLSVTITHEILDSYEYCGRRILPNSSLSPFGAIDLDRTSNYLFFHRSIWPDWLAGR